MTHIIRLNPDGTWATVDTRPTNLTQGVNGPPVVLLDGLPYTVREVGT